MKNLNKYIHEAWSGVKKQSFKQEVEAWCEDMGIENYTINSKGEIDVDGKVDLGRKNFKELPYKFGTVTGYFDIGSNKNLISLKNCPDYVKGDFACDRCINLDSLEGCPKEVGDEFWCAHCKRKFTVDEVMYLCKVKINKIYPI